MHNVQVINSKDVPNTVKKIKYLRAKSHRPILVVCDKAQMSEMLNAGADDCVRQKCSKAELEARLKALCRRGSKMRFKNTLVDSGKVSIDLTKGRVMVLGKSVEVQPSEYRAMLCLMLNQGELVTKKAISMSTMRSGVSRSAHLINTHIYNLRQKFGKVASIVTVPRRGFILET